MSAKDPVASPELTRAIADFAFGSQTFTHGSRPLAWLSPEEMHIDLSDPAQRRFGDYELLERIGQGGMGVVYRAKQHSLDRDVAVKLLAAGPWASDEFVARFRREAHHAARMQHPNIVEIYDFDHRDGLNYFSMRLVEGPSLAQSLAASGPMGDIEAAKCARLLAEAMDYAHRLDVLHLDLKPANVLIGRNGAPLIADFGLARRVDAGGSGGNEDISGTPSYMAPEQAVHASHPLSASTDIYGLGAILYEMLTGRPPFRGPDVQSTLESVVSQPPTAPRALRPDVSSDLEAICLRCLEKQPADRYPSARELADDLQRFVDGHPVSARPLDWKQRLGRWAWREPQLALALGAAALALALGGAVTLVAWKQARQAQANAEYLSLRSLLPAARNDYIYTLSGLIRTRLSEDARRSRANALARSSDPHDWVLAGLVAHSLPRSQDIDMGDEQLRRAVVAMPDDRLALLAAIRFCGWGNMRTEQGGEMEPRGDCPVPLAPERLATREPQNLYAWLSQIDRPGFDQDKDGRAIWKYNQDPVERARVRDLVAKAAQSTTWDAGHGAIVAALAKAYGVNYFPIGRNVQWYDRNFSETESADEVRFGLWQTWNEAWSTRRPNLAVIQNVCNPAWHADFDDKLRADCTKIFRMLMDSDQDAGLSIAGGAGLYKLARGTPVADVIRNRWREYQWIYEQQIWSRERFPILASEQYTQDLQRYGEWEANLREADRVAVPRTPPPDWDPIIRFTYTEGW